MRPMAKYLVFVVALVGIALITSGRASCHAGATPSTGRATSAGPYSDG
jgi:hypothetical protein